VGGWAELETNLPGKGRKVLGRFRRSTAGTGNRSPAPNLVPEWHLAKAHIHQPERLTHEQGVFGSNVFWRVSQQDKGKRLGFSAVWRLPL
jgi:hypothetical protein